MNEAIKDYVRIKISDNEVVDNQITIQLKVNGIALDIICGYCISFTIFSVAVPLYLYKEGSLTENYFIILLQYQTTCKAIVFILRNNLRNVIIRNKINLCNILSMEAKNQQTRLPSERWIIRISSKFHWIK